MCHRFLHFLLINTSFKIPVNDCNELLYSPIEPNSPRGEFLHQVALIVWDEARMANRTAFGCVDDVCRRVMKIDEPFGGKTVVLLGDFRQTCPVICCGSRLQVMDACIQKSPLWPHFNIRHLIHPIRNAEDPFFANFVNAIGDGAGPQISLGGFEMTNDAAVLSAFVFPPDMLHQPVACLRCALLAPTYIQVNAYNDEILSRVDGACHRCRVRHLDS
jgi:ATP-dependent DNA helicase PIF1